jgi:hypothetical protein
MWAFAKWCGRVLLWFLFLPVGLWRSYRHGATKRTVKAVRDNMYPVDELADWRDVGRMPPPPPPRHT